MDNDMPVRARIYIGLVVGGGGWALWHALRAWHTDDVVRLLAFIAVTVLVSGLKVNLPGIKGTMSVNFLIILIGVSQMTLAETTLLGCVGTLVQCLWKAKHPVKPVRILFSLAN